MFHPGTQKLIDHWSALPGVGQIPGHSVLEPMALGRLVGHLFSAARTPTGAAFRLAGAGIETLHGGPMRGVDWLTLWTPESRSMVAGALARTFQEARPVVLIADAERLRGKLEITIAPLRSADGAPDRLVGLYQTTATQARRTEAIGSLTARLAIPGPEIRSTGEVMGLDGKRAGEADSAPAFARARSEGGLKLPTSGCAFVSVKDDDKPIIVEAVALLLKQGFEVIATGGTQAWLVQQGLAVGLVKKALEGRPNIVDAMKNGDVQLVINTTDGSQSLQDSFTLRRTALMMNIPCYTTPAGALAAARGIGAVQAGVTKVRPAQDYGP